MASRSQINIDPKSDKIRPPIEERRAVAPADVSSVTVVNLEAGGQMVELSEDSSTYSVATIANGKVRITEVTGQSEAESLVRNGKRAVDFVSNGKGERDIALLGVPVHQCFRSGHRYYQRRRSR